MGTLLLRKALLLPPLKVTFRCLSTSDTLRATAAKSQPSNRLPKGYNPPGRYALFIQEHLKNSAPATVDARKSAFAEAAKLWKALPAKSKKEYAEKSSQVGEQRRKEFERLSGAEQQAKKDENSKRLHSIKLRRRRRVWAQTGHPKIPPNAYALYMQEQMRSAKPDGAQAVKTAFRDTASRWKSLSEEEKKQYTDKAADLREKYTRDLEKWEKKQGLKAASRKLAGGKVKARGRPKKIGRPRKSVKSKSTKSAKKAA